MDSEDQRCEYAKLIGDGLAKGIAETMQRTFRGKVEEFLLQDLQPDTQRLEVEEVARVVITPSGVEIYTFDDKVIFISFQSKLNIERMKWVQEGEHKVLKEDVKDELAGILRIAKSPKEV